MSAPSPSTSPSRSARSVKLLIAAYFVIIGAIAAFGAVLPGRARAIVPAPMPLLSVSIRPAAPGATATSVTILQTGHWNRRHGRQYTHGRLSSARMAQLRARLSGARFTVARESTCDAPSNHVVTLRHLRQTATWRAPCADTPHPTLRAIVRELQPLLRGTP